MSKKQNSISLSTVEVKYIAVGSCCTQLLRMQKLLIDYGICQEHFTIYCDNTNAINISKNPVQHSWTKHIEIRHHFIQELVEDGTLLILIFDFFIIKCTCIFDSYIWCFQYKNSYYYYFFRNVSFFNIKKTHELLKAEHLRFKVFNF